MAQSVIAVSGISGAASARLGVALQIVNTYIGDLVVELISPGGRIYNLHNQTGEAPTTWASTRS